MRTLLLLVSSHGDSGRGGRNTERERGGGDSERERGGGVAGR